MRTTQEDVPQPTCVQCDYVAHYHMMHCEWCDQYVHSDTGGIHMCTVWYNYDDDITRRVYRVCRDCGYGEP